MLTFAQINFRFVLFFVNEALLLGVFAIGLYFAHQMRNRHNEPLANLIMGGCALGVFCCLFTTAYPFLIPWLFQGSPGLISKTLLAVGFFAFILHLLTLGTLLFAAIKGLSQYRQPSKI